MRAEEPRGRGAEESTPEGLRASQSRDEPGYETEGVRHEASEGVLTLVCFRCGTEYFYGDESPPEGLACEKCGNTVFRSFYSATDDEVVQDFIDSTARELDPDDPEGDTLPGDVLDLNRD